MKIILLKDVHNLGEEGDVLEVKNGYANNFLIPNKLATLKNASSLARFEKRKQLIEKAKVEKRSLSKSQKEKLESQEISLEMQSGEKGRIYGSVTAQMIVEQVKNVLGIELLKKQVEVPKNHIKSLGVYKLKIRLYENEFANLKISILSKAEQEAKAEKEKKQTNPTDEVGN